MFSFDQRIRGLPAAREQVVAVLQSINSPHLAVPGKTAGLAQAYILGVRGQSGCGVFVYLYLPESSDCAVYVPETRTVPAEQYEQLEGEALAFAESMGFMMDNLNFRALSPSDQDAMVKSLPVFQREPPSAPAGPAQTAKASLASTLGRLLASF